MIASLLWGFLYLPAVSPIHDAARPVGLPDADLLAPGTVIFSVANIAIWGGIGFNMLVLYTALRAIPRELYEAARIDGARRARDRAADQDADGGAGARADHRLLDHRDAAGVHRADDAAAADQHDQLHLERR